MTLSLVTNAPDRSIAPRRAGVSTAAARRSLVAALATLLCAGQGQGASLTPPNLTTATTLGDNDLLLVWPYAAGGPLESMPWQVFKAQVAAGLGGTWLRPSNNLSDLSSPTMARTNLGLGTAATANVVTSGNGIGLLNTPNTWGAAQTIGVPSGGEALRIQNASLTGGPFWGFYPLADSDGADMDLTIEEKTGGGSFANRAKLLHGGTLQLLGGGPAAAPLNLSPGAAPSSPNDGDMWATSSGVFARVNGATQQLGSGLSQTWTPVITFTTAGNLSVTYAQQVGFFFEAKGLTGNVCTAWFKADTSTFTYTTASGSLEITGLPVSATANYQAASHGGLGKIWGPFSGLTVPPWLTAEGTAIILETGANSAADLTTANAPSGTNLAIRGEVTYPC